MTRPRRTAFVLLLAALVAAPLSSASAHRHGVPFFLLPFAAAAAVVGGVATIVTAPFAPPPGYYGPPPGYYAPPPAYYGPPPSYYYGR